MYTANAGAIESRWIGLLIMGVLFILQGVFVLTVFPSDFAPFSAFGLLLGTAMIVGSYYLRQKDSEAVVRQEQQLQMARQRQVQEIAAAVKSTIKIRCRYCGSLNEENASRCTSCGAAL